MRTCIRSYFDAYLCTLYSVVLTCTVSVGGSYTDQQLEGFMLVAVPLNARDETTAMGTFQVNI